MAGRRTVWTEGPAFRARLLGLQRAKGWSDWKASHASGLTDRAYSFIVQGKREEPTAGTIIKLARGFGVTTDYLLTGK